MGRLPVRRAVVRVPVAGVEEPARVGRVWRDAAAELISRLNYIQVYFLAPGVDAEHPEEDEHVERDGQRDQREDHPAVGANSEESRVVDAVVDLQLFGSTRENLVGRLGPWLLLLRRLEGQCLNWLTADGLL